MPNHESTIEDAVVDALATFLKAQLAPVQVVAEWPSPDVPLDGDAVTIVLSGPAEEEILDPYVVKTDTVSATTSDYTWAVAGLIIPIQLDAWSLSASGRSNLAAKVRRALKSGSQISLGDVWGDPLAHDVELPLAGDWSDQTASFVAEPPDMSDTPDDAQRNEYRARFDVEATATLTIVAQSPRMATIKFRERMAKTLPSSGNFDTTTTTTASGTTWTRNTP